MPVLKGISWDHPRGYQPLRAAANLWQQQVGLDIIWDARSLKEFGDLPIEKLIGNYDLIIIDHPYMGEADSNGLLVPLNDYLSKEFLEIQEKQSVGPSFKSYEYNSCLYALPVDAAAQVSAFRKDLVEKLNWVLPTETLKLKEAADILPDKYFIALPLCPTDIWCVFLSLCAQYSNGNFFSESGVQIDSGKWAIEQIREWKSFIHKDSFKMNPVQMFEQMTSKDEIIYSPFAFGYTNYSRKGFAEKLLNFCNVPQYTRGGKSSLLGGAGIAVSTQTKNLDECLAFIQFILNPEMQKTVYFKEGGQPAHLAAWEDEKCNLESANFFYETLYSLQHAYVRPRVRGFNRFQEWAALQIHECTLSNSRISDAMNLLNNQFYKICHEAI